METAPGTYEEHVAVGVVNELNELYTSPAHLTLSCKFYKQMKIFASDSTILHQLEPSVVWSPCLYTRTPIHTGGHHCTDGGSSLNEGRRRRSQSGSGFWREGERRVAMAVAAGWLSMGNRVLKQISLTWDNL